MHTGRVIQNTIWRANPGKQYLEMAGARCYIRLLSKAPALAGSELRRMICRPSSLQFRSITATAMRRSPEVPEKLASLTGKPSQKVVDLAEQIVTLNMIEVADLVEILKSKFNLTGMPMMMAPGAGAAAPAGSQGGAAAAAEAKEEKKEKTEFTIKLDSFNSADKLKVIKEIRAITGLGLKESKDLVEGAPKTIKEGVSKEDAEKIKKQIEDAGGKVSIA